MGGRGASSGVSNSGRKYGTEYETLLVDGRIKYIRFINGAATAPLETMSSADGRVYVTVNKNNRINSITYYDSSGRREREIHLHHEHDGHRPHTHIGYDNIGGRPARAVTASESRIIEQITKLWKAF